MASLSGFGVRVMVASYNNFGSIPPPFSLLEEFENWYIFFLYVWQNSPVKSSSPGLLFLENHFLNQIFDFSSNNCCVQIIYFFLIQFWWAIYFQKFVHFQVVQFVDTQLFIVFSYSFFFFFFFFVYFCGIECYFSQISCFAYLGPLSFLLGELARGLLGLFTISKKPRFWFY